MSTDIEPEILAEVFKFYYIPNPELDLTPSTDDGELTRPADSAFSALNSVTAAVSFPYRLISDSVQQRKFQAVFSAEKIRTLKRYPDGHPETLKTEEEKISSARVIADEKMQSFANSQEGQNFFRNQIIYEMFSHLQSNEVRDASEQILIQALISSWTVFEVFSKSQIIQIVNMQPDKARKLLSSPDLRDYFGKSVFDIDAIASAGYDLSGSMGTLLFANRKLDSYRNIKIVFDLLFDSPGSSSPLNADLRKINMMRNLYVHNRGIIDRQYMSSTECDKSVGDRLCLTADQLENHLLCIKRTIAAIAQLSRTDSSNVQ